MTREQKKTVAHDLFVNSNKTQVEIAKIVGITDKTLRKWADDGKWREVKAANMSVSSRVVHNLYMKILEISESDNVKYAKEISMLVNAIKNLSTKPQLSHFIYCFKEFNDFLISKQELELAKDLNQFQKLFISQIYD